MRCRAECTGAIGRQSFAPYHLIEDGRGLHGQSPYHWVDNEVDLLDLIEKHRQRLLMKHHSLEGHVVTIIREDGQELGQIRLAEFIPVGKQ